MRSGLLVLICGVCQAGAGDMLLTVRLETALRGASLAPGSAFRATVVAPLVLEDLVFIPAGSVVHGVVERGRSVGSGVIRERAWLELGFPEFNLPDGRRLPLKARLQTIDNAREEVTAQGRIKGIIAASHAYGLVQGIWYHPKPSLLSRSVAGLTGASGKVWSRYSMGPVGAAGLFAVRFIFFRLPEPEIDLPVGTELKLAVTELHDDPWGAVESGDADAAALGLELRDLPFQTEKPKGAPADDIINLALIGTQKQVEDSFHAAGWRTAEPLTRSSFARTYHAFTTMRGYPTAPVSLLLYDGVPPSMVFQKSFNTLAKRHHVRFWPAPGFENGDVWLGAATHDVGLVFNRRNFTMNHKIDPALDTERQKIVDDLRFAGCAAPGAFIERPAAVRTPSMDAGIVTDGNLVILRLLPCTKQAPAADPPAPRRRLAARLLRRVTLETRHYLYRGNIYYWVVRSLVRNGRQ